MVQQKWKEGYLPGYDCFIKGDNEIVMANTYSVVNEEGKRVYYWFPLCDTTIQSLLKYEEDVWTPVDIFDGAVPYSNGYIVFGEGSMGNEGFVAHVNDKNELNWAFFFTFSNPFFKVEIKEGMLICTSDNDIQVKIQLDCLLCVRVENIAL